MRWNGFLVKAGAACILLHGFVRLPAADPTVELECPADVNRFERYFARDGMPVKAIATDLKSVHFTLSPSYQKPEQLGLYSHFKIAGDFEIAAKFDWTPVSVPKDGYGVSCGVAIELNDQSAADSMEKVKRVSIARGNFPHKGSAYVVTTGKWTASGIDYKDEHFATDAKRGLLVLLRKKKELICLTGDGSADPVERCRVPIADATVQKVLIFADPGKAPTSLDARISQFNVRAEEITHKIAKRDVQGGWGWWLLGGGLVISGVVGAFLFRHFRSRHASQN